MKVLFIDGIGSFLDLSLRCALAGHQVRLAVGRQRGGIPSPIGRGLVDCIPDWHSSLRWADLILLSDNMRYLPELEQYRKRGFPIFGPNVEVSQWELDRAKGQKVFRDHGIKTIPYETFRSISQARKYLVDNPGRYVSKPSADDDKAMSYVSKSDRDMMFMLDYWEKNSKIKGEFIFQKFTPGIEVAVGGWMGRNGFIGPWLENFEHKKLMNDDVGVNVGESGTVVKYVRKSKLADMLLQPLEAELIRQGYTGYIDVATIVTDGGDPMPLEFTSRMGWPTQQILQCLHRGDPIEWMHQALIGQDIIDVTDEVATGVVMTIPDYPYSKVTRKSVYGYPVYGWQKIPAKHFHPAEMMAGKVWDKEKGGGLKVQNGMVTAGDYVCIITGAGTTVRESQADAYKNLDKIELPNSPMYRTDIGDRVMVQLPMLKGMGFCSEWRV